MEGNVNFFESSKMKIIFYFIFVLPSTLLFYGCELLCQAGTGTCGMSSEERYKLLHPKAYGEYFVKLGASREEWQRDWVACGGWPNGQFSGGAPQGAYTNEILAAWRQKAKNLDDCMQSKGYEHLEGYEYGKSNSK
ncbi:hypothetical protein MCEGEM3_02455 [Oxalobacteraceae bacterium]